MAQQWYLLGTFFTQSRAFCLFGLTFCLRRPRVSRQIGQGSRGPLSGIGGGNPPCGPRFWLRFWLLLLLLLLLRMLLLRLLLRILSLKWAAVV